MKTKSHIISSGQVLPSNEFRTSLQKICFLEPFGFQSCYKGIVDLEYYNSYYTGEKTEV